MNQGWRGNDDRSLDAPVFDFFESLPWIDARLMKVDLIRIRAAVRERMRVMLPFLLSWSRRIMGNGTRKFIELRRVKMPFMLMRRQLTLVTVDVIRMVMKEWEKKNLGR